MPKPVYGVVAMIQRGAALLVIRRAAGRAAAGAWCFPGGAVEAGESPAQAIEREVAEEVGLTGRAVEYLWRWTRPDGELVLDWWRVEPAGYDLVPNPVEVGECRWLTLPEIRRMPGVLPGLLEFLDRFEVRLSPARSE